MRLCAKLAGSGIFAVLLAAMLLIPTVFADIAKASTGWYDSSWQYRKKITVDSTKVPSDQTDFPLLVNLPSDADLANDALNDGDDILFSSANGTKLSHEIESFNGTSGQLVAWVRVPNLSSSTDTEIYLYYGNPSASNQEDITGTWDSNFVAVWHLKENPAGTPPQVLDSTANNHDGTTEGSWDPSKQVSGLIDGSLHFNSGIDKVKVGTFDIVAGGSGDDGITMETWFYSHEKKDGRLISKATSTSNNDHWWMLNALKIGDEYRLRFRLKTDGNTTELHSDKGNTVPLNQWVYAAATYDSSDMYIFQDATIVGDKSETGTISTDNSVKVAIGNQPPGAGSRLYKGLITEVRISNIARSQSWIQTCHNNYSSPSTFYSLGIEETQLMLPTVSTDNATQVEETTATLHGTLTNDGGESCQYRFEYGTTSGEPYGSNTGWTGSITTGQTFSANLTSLSKGTKYYFRAQANNSAGTDNGTELGFLTKPDPPASFIASVAGSTQIDLSWTKGDGANNTMILRKTGGYPADRNDGFQVYFDTGTSVSDTGLSANTTYHYKSWSELSGSQQWSDGFAATIATTGSGTPTPTPTPTPPPTAVGGTIFPVDKVRILAPWLILLFFLALGTIAALIPLRKRF